MQVNHVACVCSTSRALFPDDVGNKKKETLDFDSSQSHNFCIFNSWFLMARVFGWLECGGDEVKAGGPNMERN